MSKRSSAKHKLDRRMGENIWGRPKSPVNKREYGPGQHGQRRKSKVSDYGLQLKAKQKLKGYYGDVTEKQFKFAPTIFSARQLVSHGHIRVNGVKCNIASRLVKPGDEVTLGSKAQEMALVMEAQGLSERDIPEYVAPDGAAKVTFVRVPTLDEVPYPVKMEPNLVVEFYSR
jgi:small subunit ribosomal protein S4